MRAIRRRGCGAFSVGRERLFIRHGLATRPPLTLPPATPIHLSLPPHRPQIEHHLFPGISQYYYPAIAPLVMQTCKEFNVPYRCVRRPPTVRRRSTAARILARLPGHGCDACNPPIAGRHPRASPLRHRDPRASCTYLTPNHPTCHPHSALALAGTSLPSSARLAPTCPTSRPWARRAWRTRWTNNRADAGRKVRARYRRRAGGEVGRVASCSCERFASGSEVYGWDSWAFALRRIMTVQFGRVHGIPTGYAPADRNTAGWDTNELALVLMRIALHYTKRCPRAICTGQARWLTVVVARMPEAEEGHRAPRIHTLRVDTAGSAQRTRCQTWAAALIAGRRVDPRRLL